MQNKVLHDIFRDRFPRPDKSEVVLKFVNWKTDMVNKMHLGFAIEKDTNQDYLVAFPMHEYIVVSEEDMLKLNEFSDKIVRQLPFNEGGAPTRLVSPKFDVRPARDYLLTGHVSTECLRQRLLVLEMKNLKKTEKQKIETLTEYNYYQKFGSFRWFLIQNNINPAGLYKIPWESSQRYAFVEDPSVAEEIKDVFDAVSRGYLSIDIECDNREGFPKADLHAVTHVALDACFRNGGSRRVVLINEDMICGSLEGGTRMRGLGEFDLDKVDGKRLLCSEEVMLSAVRSAILHSQIDIVYTHNGHNFDLPYINERMGMLKIGQLEVACALDRSEPIKITPGNGAAGRFTASKFVLNSCRTVFVDTLNYFRESSRFESNKLEFISTSTFTARCVWKNGRFAVEKASPFFYEVLSTAAYVVVKELYRKKFLIAERDGDSFIGVEPDKRLVDGQEYTVCVGKDATDMSDTSVYDENYDLRKALEVADYCLHDARLVSCLALSENIATTLDTYSSLYHLPQRDVFSKRAISKNDGPFLLAMLKTNKYVYTPRGHAPQTWKIKGGKVFKPSKKSTSNYSICLDFESMYPKICIHANLGLECLVESVRFSDALEKKAVLERALAEFPYPRYTVAVSEHNITVFDREEDGLFRHIFTSGFSERKKYKNLAKHERDPVTKNFYEAMQLSIKIHINSIYGTMNNPYFLLANSLCSEACTTIGRAFLKSLRGGKSGSPRGGFNGKLLENGNIVKLFNPYTHELEDLELEGFPDQEGRYAYVVYGDTDSIFVEISNCTDFGSAEKYGAALARSINSKFGRLGMNIELEYVIKKMLLSKKKKYCLRKETGSGCSDVYKGVSTVRSDYCTWHKDTLRSVIEQLMESRNPLSVAAYIKERFMEAMEGALLLHIPYETFAVNQRYNPRSTNPLSEVVKEYNHLDGVEEIQDNYKYLNTVDRVKGYTEPEELQLVSDIKDPALKLASLKEAFSWTNKSIISCRKQIFCPNFRTDLHLPSMQKIMQLFMNAASDYFEPELSKQIRDEFKI